MTKFNSGFGERFENAPAIRAGKRTRSQAAGIVFPVGRCAIEFYTFLNSFLSVHRLIKEHWHQPVSSGAPVYLAAVLEYLVAELLELGGNAARDNKKYVLNNTWIVSVT